MEDIPEDTREHEEKVAAVSSDREGRTLDVEFGIQISLDSLRSLLSLDVLLTFTGVSHQYREAHTGMRYC